MKVKFTRINSIKIINNNDNNNNNNNNNSNKIFLKFFTGRNMRHIDWFQSLAVLGEMKTWTHFCYSGIQEAYNESMAAPTSLIGKILLRLWLYQGSGTIDQTQLNKTQKKGEERRKNLAKKTKQNKTKRQQKKAKYASRVHHLVSEDQWGVAY